MIQKPSASEIDEQAVAWATKLESEALSETDERSLEDWLSSDSRCVGALTRAQAYGHLAQTAAALYGPLDHQKIGTLRKPSVSRRDLFRAGGIIGIAAIGAIAGYVEIAAADTYSTQKGQTKVVTLSDGTAVTLNTDTELKVRFSNSRRLVHLVKGEALFNISANSSRPFVVAAEGMEVTGNRTSFSLKALSQGPVVVMVGEGSVLLSGSSSGARAVPVTANNRGIAGSDSNYIKVDRVSPEDVQDALAWKRGLIVFRGETLAEAAREFARYSEVELSFEGAGLSGEKIAGIFLANDPVGFANTVASSFGLSVKVKQNQIILSREIVGSSSVANS